MTVDAKLLVELNKKQYRVDRIIIADTNFSKIDGEKFYAIGYLRPEFCNLKYRNEVLILLLGFTRNNARQFTEVLNIDQKNAYRVFAGSCKFDATARFYTYHFVETF